MARIKITKEEDHEYREDVRRLLPPGATAYTVLRHVSRSGMMRVIDVYAIQENQPVWLSYRVAALLGWSYDKKHEGIRVEGCGMDMGFHVVYSLSRTLYADGFTCTGTGCPSNDHSNGDRNYGKHQHSDPGYALTHRWIG